MEVEKNAHAGEPLLGGGEVGGGVGSRRSSSNWNSTTTTSSLGAAFDGEKSAPSGLFSSHSSFSSSMMMMPAVDEPLMPLLRYDQLPPYRLDNPYIRSGYRPKLTTMGCLLSVFMLSNETVNIWSHLLGAFWALYHLWILAMSTVDDEEAGTTIGTPRIIFIVYLITTFMCMIFSAGYHTFNCHEEEMCLHWLRLDYLGISLGIVGCYVPGVHFAFYCHEQLQMWYTYIVAALFVFSLYMQTNPEFQTTRWRLRRIFTYGSVLLFGLIPVMHWTILNVNNAEERALFLHRVLIAFVFPIIGGLFYFARFPESCCRPSGTGRCVDYYGASHQWWHIFVLGGFMWWYYSARTVSYYRLTHACSPMS